MIVRPIESIDESELKQIHEKFYKNDFIYPDWNKHYLASLAITTDDGKIVTAGGVRHILECITLTDKSFSPRIRREALSLMLQSSLFIAEKSNHNQLHVFVEGDNWIKVLNRYGFEPAKGTVLVNTW